MTITKENGRWVARWADGHTVTPPRLPPHVRTPHYPAWLATDCDWLDLSRAVCAAAAGAVSTPAKAEAARLNGAKGGRPCLRDTAAGRAFLRRVKQSAKGGTK